MFQTTFQHRHLNALAPGATGGGSAAHRHSVEPSTPPSTSAPPPPIIAKRMRSLSLGGDRSIRRYQLQQQQGVEISELR